MDDQRKVISFLSEGASYGKLELTVERIETHISIVFLIGDRAYKLKRSVYFSYLDYSTTAMRGRFCKAELELNRRTAAALYLGLHAITRAADGSLTFDGDGAVVDWVLEMKRFSQSDLRPACRISETYSAIDARLDRCHRSVSCSCRSHLRLWRAGGYRRDDRWK
jgi:aminoglycoside phosphotransferase family enzyme